MGRPYNQGVADANRKRAKHGGAVDARLGKADPLYAKWFGIKQRCFNPDHPHYHRYGGRGVTMCDEWANDFAAFRAAVGQQPEKGMTLDREDNNRGYEPGNVRWATRKQQANNRETNVMLTHNNQTMTLKQWAEHLGYTYALVAGRWKGGERDPAVILAPPKYERNKLVEWNGQAKTLAKWAEETGVPYVTLHWRHKNGKPLF